MVQNREWQCRHFLFQRSTCLCRLHPIVLQTIFVHLLTSRCQQGLHFDGPIITLQQRYNEGWKQYALNNEYKMYYYKSHFKTARLFTRKFSIAGLYVCAWGLDILKIDKTLMIYSVVYSKPRLIRIRLIRIFAKTG